MTVWGTAREVSRVPAGIIPVALDLGNPESVAACIQKMRAEAPDLGLLVNNAGNGAFYPLEDFPAGDLEAQWRVLLHGPAELTRAFYAGFRAKKRGVIVNVTSLAGDYPIPFMSAYSGAKAGLSGFTRALMLEAAGSGVAVIDFRPGDYDTGFNDAMRGFRSVSRPDSVRARDACDAHVKAGPQPGRAAHDLWRAVARGRSGVVTSGDFFQATLGPAPPRPPRSGSRHPRVPEKLLRHVNLFMRLLIIQDYLRHGGTESHAVWLAGALRASGVDAEILTFRPGGALLPRAGAAGIPVTSLQRKDSGFDWHAPGLAAAVKARRPDAVLLMGKMANARARGLRKALPAGTRLVGSVRTGHRLPWFVRAWLCGRRRRRVQRARRRGRASGLRRSLG